MSTELILIALGVFVLAGMIKGTVGLGLPVISIGLLSTIADPRLAITLAILPIFFANIWQMYRAGEFRRSLRLYYPFALALALFMLPTIFLAVSLPVDVLMIALGIAIVLFSGMSLTFNPPAIPERWDRPAQVFFGALSGISGGLTAIWSPPMLFYFLSRRFGKEEYMRASGLMFFTGSLPLVAGYAHAGLLNFETAPLSALMTLPALAGFTFGEAIRRRMDAERFRKAVLLVFLLLGLNLLRRAFF